MAAQKILENLHRMFCEGVNLKQGLVHKLDLTKNNLHRGYFYGKLRNSLEKLFFRTTIQSSC